MLQNASAPTAWTVNPSAPSSSCAFWTNPKRESPHPSPPTKKAEGADGKDEKIIHYQLQLGDFAKLGNFLQALIGKEQFKTDDAK